MTRPPCATLLALPLLLLLLLSGCGQPEVIYVPVTVTPQGAVQAAPDATAIPTQGALGGMGGLTTAPLPPASPTAAATDSAPTTASPSGTLPADGGRIAFMGPLGDNGPLLSFVVNADGTGLTAPSEAQSEGYFPHLSPDGSRLLYMANSQSDPDIFVADVATGEATNLTSLPGFDNQPIWSPDGSQIAFVTDREGGDVDIWLMGADGSNARRVARTPGEDNLGAWSPDGTRLVFSNNDELGESLWIMEVATGATTRLTEQASGTDSAPAWSPDGQRIAFYSAPTDGTPQIFTIRPDGSDRQQVTNSALPALLPVWSPDGAWLLYTTLSNGNRYDLNALQLATGETRTVPNVQGFATTWRAAAPLPETGFTQGPKMTGVEVDAAVLEAAYRKGDPNAPITIVEFSDYQCPFCQRWFTDTYTQLQPYIDNGTVQLLFVDFPLNIHPQAPAAAQAARCAGELAGADGYWTMHDALFNGMDRWSGQTQPNPIFATLATEAGLDGATIQACVESARYAEQVTAGLQEGLRLGISGTPTFFVNGNRIVGAQPFAAFEPFLSGN